MHNYEFILVHDHYSVINFIRCEFISTSMVLLCFVILKWFATPKLFELILWYVQNIKLFWAELMHNYSLYFDLVNLFLFI